MAAELTNRRCGGSIPASAGVGLRAPHYAAFIDGAPAVRWLEVHSENYFCAGGLPHSTLAKIRERYPMSLHGVGLSIASTDPLDRAHLKKLKDVIARYEPGLVSEHLSWGSVNGLHLNDLLPVPYSLETLGLVVERVDAIQAYLGRQILIENISSYMQFAVAEMTEATFFAEL
ncbi:MAG TPA: DUF692 domain-containing protein, partial [Gammaproteobacteria bacterium]|nr:DUF692 domain-containing protein [Gammaproteobacteria bacterium]